MTGSTDTARPVDADAAAPDVMPEAPSDPLDEARALAKVWQGLFGGEAEAPRVGQYYLLRELGAGAMGVVYSAFDPELQREVALKLLHTREGAASQTDRVLREARALAKISHPNVVGVYGVGSGPRGAYIAMEYVEGQTLARWLRHAETPRPWREVVTTFIAVGRGLAAAHDAGVVHRDFKPANVLLGDDGVPRVADFGLAAEAREDPSGSETTLDDARGAATSRRIGTPAYMAPEQRSGAEPSPAADQYAFCVSLHEGLFGARPNATKIDAASNPSNRPPPAVVEAVSRGLVSDPHARHPSMHALVEALAAGMHPPRWRRFAPWLVAVASLVTGVVLAARPTPAIVAMDPCPEDTNVVAELRQASPDLELAAALDDYADGWTLARQQACLVHERGDESDALFDARVECLTRHRRAAVAVANVLRGGSVPMAAAERLIAGLPSVEQCRVPATLLSGIVRPEDPDARARGEQLLHTVREQFVRLDAGLGPNENAVAEIRAALPLAEDHLARGHAQRLLSRFEATASGERKRLLAAVTEAVLAHDPDLAVIARLELSHAQLIGGDAEAARETLAVADAANESLGALDPAYDETATWYRGLIAAEQAQHARLEGDAAAALAASRKTADAWMRFVDTSPVWVAIGLNNVGEGLRMVGRPNDAIEYYDRAEALARRRLDADDPRVISIHSNRGAARIDSGDLAGGEKDLTLAVALLDDEAAFPHALLRFNLALIAATRERHDEARRHYAAAKAIFGTFDDPASKINTIMAGVGIAANERDDAVAERALRKAHDALTPRVTAPDPRLAELILEQARVDDRAGRRDAARAGSAEAVRMLDEAGVEAGVERARALLLFAQLHDDRAALDEVKRLLEALSADHPLLAETLATAAAQRPDDPQGPAWLERARRLADTHELGPRVRTRIADAARGQGASLDG